MYNILKIKINLPQQHFLYILQRYQEYLGQWTIKKMKLNNERNTHIIFKTRCFVTWTTKQTISAKNKYNSFLSGLWSWQNFKNSKKNIGRKSYVKICPRDNKIFCWPATWDLKYQSTKISKKTNGFNLYLTYWNSFTRII